MTRTQVLTVTAVLLGSAMNGLVKSALFTAPAAPRPAFMDIYNNDAYAKPALKGKCILCHIGREGGERNQFGEAFSDGGYQITAELREKFPEMFLKIPDRAKP